MGMATPIMGIIRIVPITIGRTPTIIMGGLHSIGLEAIDITGTIVTIITIGTKVEQGLKSTELACHTSQLFFCKDSCLIGRNAAIDLLAVIRSCQISTIPSVSL
jgi:hypothetical protein